MTQLLSDDAVNAALADLQNWTRDGEAIERRLRFRDFSSALAFLVRVGIEAEKMNHHPEIANVYSRVTIRLTTHDAGGITEKDLDLAARVDTLARDMQASNADA